MLLFYWSSFRCLEFGKVSLGIFGVGLVTRVSVLEV